MRRRSGAKISASSQLIPAAWLVAAPAYPQAARAMAPVTRKRGQRRLPTCLSVSLVWPADLAGADRRRNNCARAPRDCARRRPPPHRGDKTNLRYRQTRSTSASSLPGRRKDGEDGGPSGVGNAHVPAWLDVRCRRRRCVPARRSGSCALGPPSCSAELLGSSPGRWSRSSRLLCGSSPPSTHARRLRPAGGYTVDHTVPRDAEGGGLYCLPKAPQSTAAGVFIGLLSVPD